jgi:hypothetical protein
MISAATSSIRVRRRYRRSDRAFPPKRTPKSMPPGIMTKAPEELRREIHIKLSCNST